MALFDKKNPTEFMTVATTPVDRLQPEWAEAVEIVNPFGHRLRITVGPCSGAMYLNYIEADGTFVADFCVQKGDDQRRLLDALSELEDRANATNPF